MNSEWMVVCIVLLSFPCVCACVYFRLQWFSDCSRTRMSYPGMQRRWAHQGTSLWDSLHVRSSTFHSRLLLQLLCLTSPFSFKMFYAFPQLLSRFTSGNICHSFSVAAVLPFYPVFKILLTLLSAPLSKWISINYHHFHFCLSSQSSGNVILLY